jgi:hypothetical protein
LNLLLPALPMQRLHPSKADFIYNRTHASAVNICGEEL